jgi:hypothetical protein
LFKAECIRTDVFHTGPYKTIADVEYAFAGWVDWYNNRRLHSTLGMVRPTEQSRPTTLPSTERCNHNELRYRTWGASCWAATVLCFGDYRTRAGLTVGRRTSAEVEPPITFGNVKRTARAASSTAPA